jgi:phosphoribosylformimino-5-aminoimidazole carboxamide ribotide isomerase
VDAGVSSPDRAVRVHALGCAHVIVGLETLRSFDALREICAVASAPSVAFSLDLRNGVPLATDADALVGEDIASPGAIAAAAASLGVGALIVIDLARVGVRAGLDLELLQRIRRSAPRTTLLAGGGVRDFEDLRRLAAAGCDGALVATALHDGRLQRADVLHARRLRPGLT